MERLYLMRSPLLSLVLMMGVSHIAYTTTTEPNAIEQRIQHLENIILGKFADLEHKISGVDERLRDMDDNAVSDIKQRLVYIENEIAEIGHSSSSQSKVTLDKESESNISEIKTHSTSIVEDVRILKHDIKVLDSKMNLITINDVGISAKIDTLDHQLKQGLELLRQSQKTLTEEETKVVNQEKSVCNEVSSKLNDIIHNGINILKEYNSTSNNIVGLEKQIENKTRAIHYFATQLTSQSDMIHDGINVLEQYSNTTKKVLENMNSKTSELYADLSKKIEVIQNVLNSSAKMINANLLKGCPTGYFIFGQSAQCFAFDDERLTYTEAKAKCASVGAALAQPNDPEALQAYIVNTYGDQRYYPWLGARGTGSKVQWDRDGVTVSANLPLWVGSHPETVSSSSYCLTLATGAYYMKNDSNKATYYMLSCTSSKPSICEFLRE